MSSSVDELLRKLGRVRDPALDALPSVPDPFSGTSFDLGATFPTATSHRDPDLGPTEESSASTRRRFLDSSSSVDGHDFLNHHVGEIWSPSRAFTPTIPAIPFSPSPARHRLATANPSPQLNFGHNAVPGPSSIPISPPRGGPFPFSLSPEPRRHPHHPDAEVESLPTPPRSHSKNNAKIASIAGPAHTVTTSCVIPLASGHGQTTSGQADHVAAVAAGPSSARHTNAAPSAGPSRIVDLSDDDDDVFGDDDVWMESALAEVKRVEAALPPRGATASPYFTQDQATSRPVPGLQLPPSRKSSTSPAISFPKLAGSRPNSSLGGPRPSPGPSVAKPQPAKPANPVGRSKKGGQLVSTQALETAAERQIFSFDHFNEMQSAIFQSAYDSEENLVVSAPTGSGKTVVFELTFLQMLKDPSTTSRPLAIYMAPTKALCYERAQDWRNRLSPLEVQVAELTGDSKINEMYSVIGSVDLIVTTPEKWDSITRRSFKNNPVNRLRLMMIDEVHLLHEDRGPTLEVVVARMKKATSNEVRIVAVSASVPNIDDVARWIGPKDPNLSNPTPDSIDNMPKAAVFQFGDDYRPVPLKRFTYGYDAYNDFALATKLDKELFPILVRHSDGLPIVVFCPTRKACMSTAEAINKAYEAALDGRRRLPWGSYKSQRLVLKDPKVQALTRNGIAVHHAGLDILDRRAIEQAFKDSALHMLVATSTLAVGVNLPAHLVVIQGTSMWNGQAFRDYADIDIQQMMGRAGRPQFDTSGTVVVMCNTNKLAKFREMLNCRTVLESQLHENLTEHINSEIGLGTIRSLKTAQDWLRGSFLAVRIQQNPKHYTKALVKDQSKTWWEALDDYVENALEDLESHEFVALNTADDHDGDEVISTNLGMIMSQNFICYHTMCYIVTMDKDASLRDLMEILAGADEFSNLRIRQGEGAVLNKLRVSPEVRFHLDEAVKTYADKVFLHLQVCFGNISMDKFATKTENASPLQTQVVIFNCAPRIAKAMFLVAVEKKFGGAARSAFELVRTVNGKAWEDSASIFRQIDKIGPKSITVLGSNGVHSWDDLIKMDPGRLEMWLNRHAPFGHEVIERAKEFPRFTLHIEQEGVVASPNEYPILQMRVKLEHKGILVRKADKGVRRAKSIERDKSYNLVVLFISSKDNRFLDIRKIDTRKLNDRAKEFVVEAKIRHRDETVIAIAGVEDNAGLATTVEYRPRISITKFPDPQLVQGDDTSEGPAVTAVTTPTPAPTSNRPQQQTSDERASLNAPEPPRFASRLSVSRNEAQSSKASARPAKEPTPEIFEISDEEELIDLTVPKKKRRTPKQVTELVPSKRLKISSIIDDLALESAEVPPKPPQPSNVSEKVAQKVPAKIPQQPVPKLPETVPASPLVRPLDTMIDITMDDEDGDKASVDSFAEFDQFFASPSSEPPKRPVSPALPPSNSMAIDATLAPRLLISKMPPTPTSATPRSLLFSREQRVPTPLARSISEVSPAPESLEDWTVPAPVAAVPDEPPREPTPPSGAADDFDAWMRELLGE